VALVVVMAWASPASIFGFGGAQEGPFSAALENGFSRRCPTKQVFVGFSLFSFFVVELSKTGDCRPAPGSRPLFSLGGLVSCGYGRDQNKLWLTDPNPKPTPACLSGAMRRSRAITKKRTF
jgi:hypothetical protein